MDCMNLIWVSVTRSNYKNLRQVLILTGYLIVGRFGILYLQCGNSITLIFVFTLYLLETKYR